MKKKFKVEVDCANCAQKVEDALNKLEGVNSAEINFMFGKLTLDADDINEELLQTILEEGKKVEPDFNLIYA